MSLHKHRCMRCNEEFDCQTVGICQANYDVMPVIIKADQSQVEHCPTNPDWDWIRAYGERRLAQARREGMEEAAKIVEGDVSLHNHNTHPWAAKCFVCQQAAAIRRAQEEK